MIYDYENHVFLSLFVKKIRHNYTIQKLWGKNTWASGHTSEILDLINF